MTKKAILVEAILRQGFKLRRLKHDTYGAYSCDIYLGDKRIASARQMGNGGMVDFQYDSTDSRVKVAKAVQKVEAEVYQQVPVDEPITFADVLGDFYAIDMDMKGKLEEIRAQLTRFDIDIENITNVLVDLEPRRKWALTQLRRCCILEDGNLKTLGPSKPAYRSSQLKCNPELLRLYKKVCEDSDATPLNLLTKESAVNAIIVSTFISEPVREQN